MSAAIPSTLPQSFIDLMSCFVRVGCNVLLHAKMKEHIQIVGGQGGGCQDEHLLRVENSPAPERYRPTDSFRLILSREQNPHRRNNHISLRPSVICASATRYFGRSDYFPEGRLRGYRVGEPHAQLRQKLYQ